MLFYRSSAFHFPRIWVVLGFSVVGLLFVGQQGHAQRAGREQPPKFMERIDREEGARRLADFRQQRLRGDYWFRFELEHKPRRARTIRYQGQLWGSWDASGPVTRLRVQPSGDAGEGSLAGVELLVRNGREPAAWRRGQADSTFEPVVGNEIFEPILPGLLYSIFDFQMPFIYWDDFIYEGPELAGATRIVQQFLMLAPDGSASAARGIKGVRVGVDDTYNALLRIEVINTDDAVVSKFAVESFKEVQGQYIVKRITLTDYPSKDRTTFEVESAEVDLDLSRDYFEPTVMDALNTWVPTNAEAL